MSTFFVLPATGFRPWRCTPILWCAKDRQLLFRLRHEEERRVFGQLLKISGSAARTAAAGIVWSLSVSELYRAVSTQEWRGVLPRFPASAGKTAERLLLELRDKLAGGAAPSAIGAMPGL